MSENSHIQWTDHTFNPWIGCTKVSPGCLHCYAETLMDTRYGRAKWGKGNPRQRTSDANWKLPLKWNKQAGPIQWTPPWHRPRVFCASLADWLDDEVQIEWLADLLKLIHDTPNLDWLLLTKRPENWRARIIAAGDSFPANSDMRSWCASWRDEVTVPENVWIGTTVEDQTRADERIPHLLNIPARVRFLSCEPLLSEVRLHSSSFFADEHLEPTGNTRMHKGKMQIQLRIKPDAERLIHWVIAGSESGPHRRPMQTEWAQSLADQCKAAGVAFFMKQMGVAGKVTGEVSEFPESLQVREFPCIGTEVSA